MLIEVLADENRQEQYQLLLASGSRRSGLIFAFSALVAPVVISVVEKARRRLNATSKSRPGPEPKLAGKAMRQCGTQRGCEARERVFGLA
jgi:hypothetical protein